MTLTAAAERAIDAPAADLYTYVSDFVAHHPHFLPPAFADFAVESGGVGVGTVTSSTFTIGGRTQHVRTLVTRTEPGRLIEEAVLGRPMTTMFTFVRTADATTTARIETTWRPAGGLSGLLERLFAPRALARIYAEELELLDRYAAERQDAVPGAAAAA
ncbi:MAG TPA: SRPBCC family protein [Candidatus Limnocylindrales bacterium]|jgi:hypothetical protein